VPCFEKDIALNHPSTAWRTLLLHGRTRVTLATLRSRRRPFEARERWRDVSLAAFETFLREYPRPLEARPRLTPRARHREWMDATLGSWPANAVAKCWTRGRSQGFQIRSV